MTKTCPIRSVRQDGFRGLRHEVLEALGITSEAPLESAVGYRPTPTAKPSRAPLEQEPLPRLHLKRNARRLYTLWGQCRGCLDTFTIEAEARVRVGEEGPLPRQLSVTDPRVAQRSFRGAKALFHVPCDREVRVFDMHEAPMV